MISNPEVTKNMYNRIHDHQRLMVPSTVYKGIEFVRVSSLPKIEQDEFQRSFNSDLLIKVLVDEEIIHDCIQYKDYALWYAKTFLREGAPAAKLRAPKEPEPVGSVI